MKRTLLLMLLTLQSAFLCFLTLAEAKDFRVLVVMSYEEPGTNPWCGEVKEGIDGVLGESADIDYFYMDTKKNFAGGEEKAKAAYDLYNRHAYDGVIAIDDNAQSMFVVPYLKDKVKTPVIFGGVNAEPEEYGYPSTNVSGILERGHFRESIALLKQLSPAIKKVGFIAKDSPSGRAIQSRIEKESDQYLVEVVTFELISSLSDLEARSKLKECDALFIVSINGIVDMIGESVDIKKIVNYLYGTYEKPIVGANNLHVQAGALCAVIKTGQEQGEGAALKLLEAMRGKPVSDIPVVTNYKGRRVINVSAIEMLQLSPKPITFLGSTLIKTEK